VVEKVPILCGLERHSKNSDYALYLQRVTGGVYFREVTLRNRKTSFGASEVTMQVGERGCTKALAIKYKELQYSQENQLDLVTDEISKIRKKRQWLGMQLNGIVFPGM
jgi:hypothetical protein